MPSGWPAPWRLVCSTPELRLRQVPPQRRQKWGLPQAPCPSAEQTARRAGTCLSGSTACRQTAGDHVLTPTCACAQMPVSSTCCHVTWSTTFLH